MDVAAMTHEDFQRCLRHIFTVKLRDPESTLDLELSEVKTFGADGQARQPFSALFRGPLEPALAQGSYPMTSDALGELELFLVPVGRDADGMRYDATFT